MASLDQIKLTLSQHFNAPVTPERLSEPMGTQSVKAAKVYGIYIALKAGYKAADIAAAFGLANEKSASNAMSRARKEYQGNLQFREAAQIIAAKLDPDLKLD